MQHRVAIQPYTSRTTAGTRPRARTPLIALFCACVLCGTVRSQAAESDKGGAVQLQEIVVTAERRQSNVQRTPVDISVVGGAQLIRRGITSVNDIADVVPGVKLYHERGGTSVFIRGVGNSASNPYADPDVTVNEDGVPQTLPSGANNLLFDVARMEILKGPQGTLYGRNATAGAINIVTNDPLFRSAGSLGITAGSYGLFETTGMLNEPLAEHLAARVAFDTKRHSGYLSDGLDAADDYAGRVKLLWKPLRQLSVLLGGEYDHLGGKGDQRVPVITSSGAYYWPSVLGHGDPWTMQNVFPSPTGGQAQLIPANPYQVNDNWRIWAHIDWNLGFANLVALPAYQSYREDWNDADQGFGFLQTMHDISRSLEIRLGSNRSLSRRLIWVIGVYGLNENLPNYVRVQQSFPQIGAAEPELVQITSTPHDVTRSYAGFAQASYAILPSLRLIAGARYTNDRKVESGYTSNEVLPGVFSPFNEYWKVQDHKVTWRLGFAADLTRRSMLYGNVATGYKAGGFGAAPTPGLTPGLTVDPSLVPLLTYKPEELRAYDVGIKNTLLHRRMRLNAEAFYWIYTNQQVQSIFLLPLAGLPPVIVPAVVNAGRGIDKGLDLSTEYLLTSSDRIRASVEYLSTRYGSFTYPFIFPNNPVNDSGKPFNNAPRWAGDLGYTHIWTTRSGATVAASVDSYLTEKYWVGYSYLSPSQVQNGFTRTDLSLGYDSSTNRWSVRVWVKNIENGAVKMSAGSSVPGSTTAPAPRGPDGQALQWMNILPPRTFGVTLRVKF